jgi:hypothetical protein
MGLATALRATGPGFDSLGLSLRPCPWVPLTFPVKRYGAEYPRDEETDTDCHLQSRSRTVQLYLHSSIRLHGVVPNYVRTGQSRAHVSPEVTLGSLLHASCCQRGLQVKLQLYEAQLYVIEL